MGFSPNESIPSDVLDLANLIISETTKSLDSIISNLENGPQRKFCIIRNPMPLIVYEQYRPDLGRWQRNWNWASFNNCLVEIDNNSAEKSKKIWLPTYINAGMGISQLSEFTAKNRLIFESLGFSVFQMKNDYSLLANMRGSLHCITNNIKRI